MKDDRSDYDWVNDITFSDRHTSTEYLHEKKLMVNKIYNNNTAAHVDFNFSNNMTKKIIIYSDSSHILKQIDFAFEDNNSNLMYKIRHFLKTIDFKDANGNTINAGYQFEYDSLDSFIDIFNTHPYAMDHLGYYNGKINNPNLIPDNIDSELVPQALIDRFKMQGYHFADREADFNFTKFGSLTKVIYPSKGFTAFEYESGKDGYKKAATAKVLHIDYSRDNDTSNDTTVATNTFTATIDGTATIQLTSSGEGTHHLLPVTAILTILDTNTMSSETEIIAVGSPHIVPNPPVLHSSSASFNVINGHHYQFTFQFTNDLLGSGSGTPYPYNMLHPNARILATANLALPILGPEKDALGIRIKRIISKKSPDDNSPLIKRYYYRAKESYQDSAFVIAPNYLRYDKYNWVTRTTYTDLPFGSSSQFINTLRKESISSNNLGLVTEDESGKKLFPVVTVSYGGDNFENGGEELFFKVKKNIPPSTYYYPLTDYNNSYQFPFSSTSTNSSWNNGTLYKKNIFKKDGNTFKVLKKTETSYLTDESKSYTNHNIIVEKNSEYSFLLTDHTNPIINLKIGLYDTYSKWHAVDTIKTTAYFGTDSIETIQKYFYDTGLAGIPTRIQTTRSDGSDFTKKIYYPNQVTGVTSLPGAALSSTAYSAIQKLKANQQHRIATPIQTETYKYSALLSTQRSDYKDWGQNATHTDHIVALEKIKTSKESKPLEDRIVYHNYDNKGNPLEISKADGKHIFYIWGYDQTQPIAKIEGLDTLPIATTNFQSLDYSNEQTVLAALATLRAAIPDNAMITTMTYKPLIGLSTITDPKGDMQYYFYDNFNRLQYVKDAAGNILSENQYHYRPQN